MTIFFNPASTTLETLKLGGATFGAMGYGYAVATGVVTVSYLIFDSADNSSLTPDKCIKVAAAVGIAIGIVFQNLTASIGIGAIASSLGFAAVHLAKSASVPRLAYLWIPSTANVVGWLIGVYAVYKTNRCIRKLIDQTP